MSSGVSEKDQLRKRSKATRDRRSETRSRQAQQNKPLLLETCSLSSILTCVVYFCSCSIDYGGYVSPPSGQDQASLSSSSPSP